MSLRADTIRLAHQRPSLRAALLPVLAREFPNTNALHDYLEEHPDADKSKHWVREHGADEGPTHETKVEPKKKDSPEEDHVGVAARVKQFSGKVPR